MESIYLQPSFFKLNVKTGKFKVVREVSSTDIFAMTKYLLADSIKNKLIWNVECARDFLIYELATEDRKVFACLFLNGRQRVIGFEKLFYGTIDEAAIFPREIVKRALLDNAHKVICVHNHPSGVTDPSLADIDVTQVIRRALKLVNIELMDHFIVAGNYILSICQTQGERYFTN